jgi:translation initiation factor 5B
MGDKKKKPNNKPKPAPKNAAMIAKIKEMQELKRQEEEKIRLEEEKIRKEEEEELKKEEEENKRKEVERLEKARKKEEEIAKQKREGRYMTKAQKKKWEQKRARAVITSSVALDTDKSKEEEVITEAQEKEIKIKESVKIDENIRSPICCVLGHVDTGKTKILDYIRKTNIQDKEVGGITQQIGASYFPIENIRQKTKDIEGRFDIDYNIPGILMIDTPGHESFSNLRHRGSSLCDIAILIVDIVHGLEKQTIESIKILKEKNIPFIVALNKIDRIYDWQPIKDAPIHKTIKQQNKHSIEELESRILGIKTELAEQGLNTQEYMKNKQLKQVYSLVPVSAITGEGIPDLLALMVFLTQKWMTKKLTISEELECSVMEVKTEEGLGTTLDVILSDGILHEGDKIIMASLNGPVVTNIRSLLTPKPMKEMRVKNEYINHKMIKASMGLKIVANDLENIVAGSSVIRIDKDDTNNIIEQKKEQIMQDVNQILDSKNFKDEGVYVKASTLGSLEAFLTLLKQEKIPVSGASIGPIFKKDLMRASRALINDKREYSVILVFNMKISSEMEQTAKKDGVHLITGEIVYNIVDSFKKYYKDIKEVKKESNKDTAIFPCVLQMMGKKFVFNRKNPFVFGVTVNAGKLKLGTPLIVPDTKIVLGKVTSIEKEHKKIDIAEVGSEVCIKVDTDDPSVTMDRHFSNDSQLMSNINRESIDCLKEHYKDEMSRNDWMLVIEMKKVLEIN